MRAFANHIQWTGVKEVTERLKVSGFQALLAGGCVRDLLMGREPNDFDIATDATPEQVEALFPQSIAVGKAFGVIIVPFENYQLEIATFREDLGYTDGRRPEGVRFSTAEQDAKRRDFTVNALFLDLETQRTIDYVQGEVDIRKKLIRTVGDADRRFDEDKLRILRAVRFAAQLDFEIVPEALEAIVRRAPDVSVVSRERIRDELQKLLKSAGRMRGLELLASTGLLKVLFPALAPLVFADVTAWLKRFALHAGGVSETAAARLALFFYPAFQKFAEREFREQFLKGLRLDNKLSETILFAMRNLPSYLNPQQVRRGEMALLLARPESQVAEEVASVIEREKLGPAPTARGIYLSELRKQVLTSEGAAPKPWLNGDDVAAAGIPPGAAVGKLLHDALLLQLEGQLTSREAALQWLKDSPR